MKAMTKRLNENGGEPTSKGKMEKKFGYYTHAFQKLIENGVPKWYIRLYALDDLIYFTQIYFYRNAHDVETYGEWYTTKSIPGGVYNVKADKDSKCYGELQNRNFPCWEEYRLLFKDDEYDNREQFFFAYEQHKNEWWEKWNAYWE
jgi:hypothetical protein